MDTTSAGGLLSSEDLAAEEQAAWNAYQAAVAAADRVAEEYRLASTKCSSTYVTWTAAHNAIREAVGRG